jgi:hypothetical protein
MLETTPAGSVRATNTSACRAIVRAIDAPVSRGHIAVSLEISGRCSPQGFLGRLERPVTVIRIDLGDTDAT